MQIDNVTIDGADFEAAIKRLEEAFPNVHACLSFYGKGWGLIHSFSANVGGEAHWSDSPLEAVETAIKSYDPEAIRAKKIAALKAELAALEQEGK